MIISPNWSKEELESKEIAYFSTRKDVDQHIAERQIKENPYRVAEELLKSHIWISSSQADELKKKGTAMVESSLGILTSPLSALGPLGTWIGDSSTQELKSNMISQLEKNPVEGWNMIRKAGIVKQGLEEALEGTPLNYGAVIDNPVATGVFEAMTQVSEKVDDIGEGLKKAGNKIKNVVEEGADFAKYIPYIAVVVGGAYVYSVIK
jgi:ElaB/YqjD/DUF883 family membrane-anchored ribosome-binding protein